MSFLRNPWFITLAGAVALVAYGITVAPISALVLGTPFYVAVLIYAWSDKLDAAAVGAAVAERGGTMVVLYVACGLAVAALAYLIWGRFTDTGLIGWLDALQARSDGRYSPKLSFVVGVLYVAEPFLLFVFAQQWFAARRRPAARPAGRVLP